MNLAEFEDGQACVDAEIEREIAAELGSELQQQSPQQEPPKRTVFAALASSGRHLAAAGAAATSRGRAELGSAAASSLAATASSASSGWGLWQPSVTAVDAPSVLSPRGDFARWSWICYGLQENDASSPMLQTSSETVFVSQSLASQVLSPRG